MKASFVVMIAVVLAGCSGGDGGGKPSQSVADAWPAKWCQAQPGISKDQLVTLMGPPTSATDATATWSAHQYQFNAFLAADGTVDQLDINQHSLSEAEKAALKCNTVRDRDSLAAQNEAPARPVQAACALVTQEEMSAILGSAVVAEAPRASQCHYKSPTGISPYVEFSLDVGDGAAGMAGAGFAGSSEPGMVSPYAGIGDQAVAVGPALMIRTGEDLVTIVFSGVDDVPAAAKKIFDTAKAKM